MSDILILVMGAVFEEHSYLLVGYIRLIDMQSNFYNRELYHIF